MLSQAHPSAPFRDQVVLALGSNQTSNLGGPKETVEIALATLAERLNRPLCNSRLFATPAFPEGAGPDFVNAAVAFETDLCADEVLALCHEIEQSAGRMRDVRWGQRTLDIDLIAFGGTVLPNPEVHQHWRDLPLVQQTQETPAQLIVPHPRVQDRAFVLIPMMDVAPDWMHPILNMTTRQMLDARPEAEKAAVCLIGVA